MLVYLASSLRNRAFNTKLADLLMTVGYSCFLPQRDAPQEQDGKVTAETNVEAILRANLVLVIGKNLGNDTAWEAGFAKALGKMTVLLYTRRDKVRTDFMIFFSVDKVVCLSSYSELESKLPVILQEIIDKDYSKKEKRVPE